MADAPQHPRDRGVPSARQLLEEVDELMRRNRQTRAPTPPPLSHPLPVSERFDEPGFEDTLTLSGQIEAEIEAELSRVAVPGGDWLSESTGSGAGEETAEKNDDAFSREPHYLQSDALSTYPVNVRMTVPPAAAPLAEDARDEPSAVVIADAVADEAVATSLFTLLDAEMNAEAEEGAGQEAEQATEVGAHLDDLAFLSPLEALAAPAENSLPYRMEASSPMVSFDVAGLEPERAAAESAVPSAEPGPQEAEEDGASPSFTLLPENIGHAATSLETSFEISPQAVSPAQDVSSSEILEWLSRDSGSNAPLAETAAERSFVEPHYRFPATGETTTPLAESGVLVGQGEGTAAQKGFETESIEEDAEKEAAASFSGNAAKSGGVETVMLADEKIAASPMEAVAGGTETQAREAVDDDAYPELPPLRHSAAVLLAEMLYGNRSSPQPTERFAATDPGDEALEIENLDTRNDLSQAQGAAFTKPPSAPEASFRTAADRGEQMPPTKPPSTKASTTLSLEPLSNESWAEPPQPRPAATVTTGKPDKSGKTSGNAISASKSGADKLSVAAMLEEEDYYPTLTDIVEESEI